MRQKKIATGILLVFFLFPSWIKNNLAVMSKSFCSSDALESQLGVGDELYQEGFYEEALKAFQNCLDLAQKEKNQQAEAELRNRIGLIYWNIGRMDDSVFFIRQALSLARLLQLNQNVENGEAFLEIFKFYTEGKELRAEKRYEESILCFTEAVKLSKAIGSMEHELKCSRQLSLTYWLLFRLQEFHESSLKALFLARALHHRREEAKALINVGLYYQKTENYSKALINYKQALEIARENGNKADESACLNNIGILYRRIGDFERSLENLREALSLDMELGNKIFISQDMNNIGTTFRLNSLSTGNDDLLEEALKFYLEALRIARNGQDIQTEIEVLNNIGIVHSVSDEFDRALKCFHLAIALAEEFPYLEAKCMVLNNTADVYLKMGVCAEAEKLYKEAIELGQLIGRGYILWEAFYGLGQCYERENKIGPALDCYVQALNHVDLIRSRIALDAYKAGFTRDKIKIYESLLSLLYVSGRSSDPSSLAGEIFSIIEQAKARAFLESLGESRVDILKRMRPELEKREKEITSFITQCVHELSDPELSREKRQTLQERMRQAEEEYLVLLARIRAENPDVFSMLAPEFCRLERVQSDLLDDRTAVVEYFLGEKESFGLVITDLKAEIFLLPPKDEAAKMLRAYLKILSEPPSGRFKGYPAARRLYDVFFEPATRALPPRIENLIVIPDGILYYLPFETLVYPGEKGPVKGEYLIQKFAMSYAPSCSSLFSLMKREKRDKPLSLLAFGSPQVDVIPSRAYDLSLAGDIVGEIYAEQGFKMHPLPHSGKEARKIARLFDRDCRRIYLDKEASEETFKNLSLQDYTVIHFACHGFLDEQSPFRSALVLARDKSREEDGFLQVREIYNLRVAAELVVLSACQTAKGKMESAEGVLGLPRIFFYAGARSVLTSLWMIQDRTTARFMTSFYKKLVSRCAKAQALRLAKLEMIRSRFSHPYYWAAFVLNGEFSSILNTR